MISNVKDAYALERAKKHGIDHLCIENKNKKEYEAEMIRILEEKEVDLIVLAGYMKILSENFVDRFEQKIINIHPSLIPAFSGKGYYGLKVHEEALKRGVKITGATVHFVTKGADEGPIIIQKAVETRENDTPETLQKRVMEEAEWIIYTEAINMIIQGRYKS